MIHTKYKELDYIKQKKKGKRKTHNNLFCNIPGFSRYAINKVGSIKILATKEIIDRNIAKRSSLYLKNDSNATVRVDVISLLSQAIYGPNNFPLLDIDDDLYLSDEFTAEDVKVNLLLCLSTFKLISMDEFEMCGIVFRHYRDTPLFISRYGNIFNSATGMILKIPQRNGYYTLPAFYGGIRIQRVVYETWVDYFNDDKVIDHINCRPWDNFDENLEPVTIRENTRRAIVNSCKSYIMDWDTANKMCKDLAFPNPISPQQASKKYGVPIHVPRFIVQGLTWKEIAEENNLVYPDYNLRQHSEVTSGMISDAKSGMSIDSFAEKYKFGGRKLQCMYKSSLSAKK